jgi:hypothetical protein
MSSEAPQERPIVTLSGSRGPSQGCQPLRIRLTKQFGRALTSDFLKCVGVHRDLLGLMFVGVHAKDEGGAAHREGALSQLAGALFLGRIYPLLALFGLP